MKSIFDFNIKRGREDDHLMESCSVSRKKILIFVLRLVPHLVLCLMCAAFKSERLSSARVSIVLFDYRFPSVFSPA
jgi:hypothetical protein